MNLSCSAQEQRPCGFLQSRLFGRMRVAQHPSHQIVISRCTKPIAMRVTAIGQRSNQISRKSICYNTPATWEKPRRRLFDKVERDMTSKVTLTLQADDAEPILRQAAREAAKYGALCDYITRRTYNPPSNPTPETVKCWRDLFLAAKRKVEAFGVEYESTSEEETLTLHHPYVGGKRVPLGNTGFHQIVGSKPDYKHPVPCYRGEVHSNACNAAADRVVRAWRQIIEAGERIAA